MMSLKHFTNIYQRRMISNESYNQLDVYVIYYRYDRRWEKEGIKYYEKQNVTKIEFKVDTLVSSNAM